MIFHKNQKGVEKILQLCVKKMSCVDFSAIECENNDVKK